MDADTPALAVVGELGAVNVADSEIVGFGMKDEQSANSCRGLDGVVVVESDIHQLFCVQNIENDTFQRVVRTGGIAESNS